MQNSVCGLCISFILSDEVFSRLGKEDAATMCKRIGSELAPHECEEGLQCLCGCNWLTPAEATKKQIDGSWKPRTECMFCGSQDIRLNLEQQQAQCRACSAGWGCALFWKPIMPSCNELRR